MKHIIVASMITAALVGIAAMAHFRAKQRYAVPKIIVVGVTPEYPPYMYREYSGSMMHKKPEQMHECSQYPTPCGFEIDLLREIGRYLDVHMVIKQLPFEALLPALELGQVHIIAAGLTPVIDRAQTSAMCSPCTVDSKRAVTNPCAEPTELCAKLSFSHAYISDIETVIVVPKKSLIQTVEQAMRASLVTPRGAGAYHIALVEGCTDVQQAYSLESCFQMLARDQADGILIDMHTLMYLSNTLDVSDYRILHTSWPHTHIALGCHSQNLGLISAVNDAIEHIRDAIDTLGTRWNVSIKSEFTD